MKRPVRVLVLSADYPSPDGKVALQYVHVRNKYYVSHGIDVTVLNFKAQNEYVLDGVRVIPLEIYESEADKEYDILVSHAPNIRNHYIFLKRYEKRFRRLVFFFHGHEVLRKNATYSNPYFFVKKSPLLWRIFQDIYDWFKLCLWKIYYPKLAEKSRFVFVSEWMRKRFFFYTRIKPEKLLGNDLIINNSIGVIFERKSYDINLDKEYDFVTIRSNLDGSKYSIDIVNDLAKNNPDLSFLVIGKGQFFSHFTKAENITWENTTLSHEKIVDVLNKCRCGLMPTRLDAQGLMTCELAVFGIPVITSDIDVCHEFLEDMPNVALIRNEDTSVKLKPLLERLTAGLPYEKDKRYFAQNIVMKEIDLIFELASQ
jgi:glycosyltransferase involved in cell wall biosynthesis